MTEESTTVETTEEVKMRQPLKHTQKRNYKASQTRELQKHLKPQEENLRTRKKRRKDLLL